MCQINIVGDVPFPVGNYTNIDQSAIKKQSLSKLSFIANAILNRIYYCGKNQFNTVFCSTVYFVLFQIPMYDCMYTRSTIKLINLDSEINATLTLSLNLVTEHLKLSVQS